ncbi:MAG: rhodanese-like domain-containing protein [Candidatus Spechtbacterales bacterium]|nr:rhodanese-like domain-containing protein [Candidatus Spechtbacterales bacterium]
MADYKTISAKDLKQKLDSDEEFLLVDVLSEASYESMHIPGAINVDVHQDDFMEKMKEKTDGDKEKEIVVYCASPQCQASPSAAQKLVDAGYENVSDFEGGLSGWKEAGYDLEGSRS